MTRPIFKSLALPNTLGLPAAAKHCVVVTHIDQLAPIFEQVAETAAPVYILGSGSNVVLPRKLNGIAVLMRVPGIAAIDGDRTKGRFEVGGGESWQGFVRFCLGQGLGGGIENLGLIPGTVGAAPIQNIGAYGVEVAEFIEAVEVLDRQSSGTTLEWKPAAECQFGYRDSCFKQQPNRWMVTRVRFKLPAAGRLRTAYAGIKEELERMGVPSSRVPVSAVTVAEAVTRTRRRKLPDPRQHPNAGSFFQNPVLGKDEYQQRLDAADASGHSGLVHIPSWEQGEMVKLSAAALIDRAGWKDRPTERVGVWQRQPLVMVNRGGADATDIMRYAQAVQQSVVTQFGVTLQQEPQLLGEGQVEWP